MLDANTAQNAPKTIFAKDYHPPEFLIDQVDLEFNLDETNTRVSARLMVRRNGQHTKPLILQGEEVKLLELKLNGGVLTADRYDVLGDELRIAEVSDVFELDMVCEINPKANTELSGLYLSGGNFCTQCEAEGFRRIIYFLDRPDVLARYSTLIRAKKDAYPVLLSNGNPEATGEGEDGTHWAKWVDPFPKPSYLFALVAGNLKPLNDSFTTMSGRQVDLNIYVAENDLPKCDHAMASLKNAMRWDEEVYGLEYDLDVYNIVAVSDFNMGAMENKGLNVFNTRYVLASPDTATDQDFDGVEGVIGHEYFHNWTGNRVTCRDWFQLSLKEGLTVFRDQEFSADQGSRAVKRIEDVRALRAIQFPEDRGPMAHPVRPESYIEINNFYTPTVYNKGAEVIRMMHGLLGAENFRKGMDLYFERHDGQAVTCDDFVAAMADASGVNLDQFKVWYAQAGTPKVSVEMSQDLDAQTLTLNMSQHVDSTPGQDIKEPMVIPIRTAFFAQSGAQLETLFENQKSAEHMVLLTKKHQQFHFENVAEKVVPSLLRGFSAPVDIETSLDTGALAYLARFDTDPFNRWEAMQRLAIGHILKEVEQGSQLDADELISAIESTLNNADLDAAFIAEAITLPSDAILGDHMEKVAVEAIFESRRSLRQRIAGELNDLLLDQFNRLKDKNDKAVRKLKNCLLGYLTSEETEQSATLAFEQFQSAQNMTDESAALACLSHFEGAKAERAIQMFYEKWKDEALVLDKWFSIQAMSQRDDCLSLIQGLAKHQDYKRNNPNRVRSLVGAFAFGNQRYFNDISGVGYRFLRDEVLAVDKLNPQTAARLLAPLGRWRRFEEDRASLMRAELQAIVDSPKLSKDVYEIASKSLG